jgi:hypothetical protein
VFFVHPLDTFRSIVFRVLSVSVIFVLVSVYRSYASTTIDQYRAVCVTVSVAPSRIFFLYLSFDHCFVCRTIRIRQHPTRQASTSTRTQPHTISIRRNNHLSPARHRQQARGPLAYPIAPVSCNQSHQQEPRQLPQSQRRPTQYELSTNENPRPRIPHASRRTDFNKCPNNSITPDCSKWSPMPTACRRRSS